MFPMILEWFLFRVKNINGPENHFGSGIKSKSRVGTRTPTLHISKQSYAFRQYGKAVSKVERS